MKPKSQERGQALILIVFAAVGFFALVALAIDGSRVFSDRRHAQNAADTAVLAAALAKIRNPSDPIIPVTAATQRAESNGFNNTNSVVEVNTCDVVAALSLTPPCEGLPTGAVLSEYIQVVIRFTTPTTFARIIGRNEVKSVVTAIARVQGSSSTSSSMSDAGIVTTRDTNDDGCFLLTGGGSVYTHNSGVWVNCSGNRALFVSGGGSLQMEATGEVVGCNDHSDPPTLGSVTCGANGGLSQPISSIFASVPTTLPPPACGPAAPLPVNGVYSPGTYDAIIINGGTATMNPGVYCITGPGGFDVSTSLTATGGKVQIVMQDQNISFSGVVNASDLEFYVNNANLTVNGGASVQATRLRYFSTGTGTVKVNGQGELRSSDAYFYLHRGDIILTGDAIVDLHGPPQGDTFGGLLVHKPLENTLGLTFNGGSNINLTGTFMAPGSNVTYNGQTTFTLHSQIIGSTFNVTGGGTLDVWYDPTENYSPPNSPVIQLTK